METKALNPTTSFRRSSQESQYKSSTLADEGNVAGACHVGSEGRVEPPDRVHDAEAIRADQAHSAAAKLFEHLALEFLSMLPVFFKARGDDNGSAHSCGYALANHAGDGIGGSNDDGEIDRLRNLFDIRVCLDPEHAGALFADRVDGAAEGATDQAPENSAANTPRAIGSANDRDALRPENCVEWMAFGAQHIVRLILRGAMFADFSRSCRTHRW